MLRTKARHIDYILKMLYTWEEWEKEDNILRGKKSYPPQEHPPVCDCLAFKIDASLFLFSFLWISRCCCHGAFKYFMALPTFMRQPMIPRYRFISPIKKPCRCPHMSRPWLLICSPRFSAWLINKCPCNFAQLVSHSSHRLNGEEKHIPFWCTSERTQTPHQVVLITASRPYWAVCQWPPSLGPTAAGLCTPDKCCCHQPPQHVRPPPFIILLLYFPPFPVLPLSLASSPMSIPVPPFPHLSFILFLLASLPSCFPTFPFPIHSLL